MGREKGEVRNFRDSSFLRRQTQGVSGVADSTSSLRQTQGHPRDNRGTDLGGERGILGIPHVYPVRLQVVLGSDAGVPKRQTLFSGPPVNHSVSQE